MIVSRSVLNVKFITLLFMLIVSQSAFGAAMVCGYKPYIADNGSTQWIYTCSIEGGGGGGGRGGTETPPPPPSPDPGNPGNPGTGFPPGEGGGSGGGSGTGSGNDTTAPGNATLKEQCQNTAQAKYDVCNNSSKLAGERIYMECWDELGLLEELWLERIKMNQRYERRCSLAKSKMLTATSNECIMNKNKDLNEICLKIP
jgi:hypothetical protein